MDGEEAEWSQDRLHLVGAGLAQAFCPGTARHSTLKDALRMWRGIGVCWH